MKAFKRIFVTLLILALAVVIINMETDFFSAPENYFPALIEKYPQAGEQVREWSAGLSRLTEKIPPPSKLWAMVKNEELPVDPEDVAVNAYISDSPLLCFYPDESIGIQIEGADTVCVFGVSKNKEKSNLVALVSDRNGEELSRTSFSVNGEQQFKKNIAIPKTEEHRLELSVYTGAKAYGQFQSWVTGMYLVKNEQGSWELERSPVYEHNKTLYEKNRSISEAKKATPSVQSDQESIRSIAVQLTQGASSEYDKLVAIHDWVSSYLYYDADGLAAGETVPYTPIEVVRSRKAVCLGYANLFAALCRSVDIPCNVVSGYALGVGQDKEWTEETINTAESNHAWNEAYVDGRWVIVDPTWDSQNRYEKGERIKNEQISHLYFDANLEFFSRNHKILEYMKR